MLWGFSRDEAVGQACAHLKGFFAGEAVPVQANPKDSDLRLATASFRQAS